MLRGIAVLIGLVALLVGVMWATGALGVLYYSTFAPRMQSAQREAIKESLPFVQSKQELLLALAQDYDRLTVEIAKYREQTDVVIGLRAQQTAIVNRMKAEAASLSQDQVPPQIWPYIQGGR